MMNVKKIIVLMSIVIMAPLSVHANQWNAVADGGFEEGSPNPYWNEMPTGIIMQNPDFVHSGEHYARLGMDAYPTSSVDATLSQEITPGTGNSSLSLWVARVSTSENGQDYIRVLVDQDVIFEEYSEAGGTADGVYHQVYADLGNTYGDYQQHTLSIIVHLDGFSNTGYGSMWYVDDVEFQTEDVSQLAADFHWSPEFPVKGTLVQFSDDSMGNPDGRHWDFGDGTSSDVPNANHTYTAAGSFSVTLTVTRSADMAQDSIQKNITVLEPIQPEFSWQPDNPGAGDQVSFFDISGGYPDSWSWDFGDGTTSTDQNPVHTYTAEDSYTVVLEIDRGVDGAHGRVEHVVEVGEPLFAEFTWTPINAEPGEQVNFSNSSTGNPDSFSWDFDDGTGSSQENPIHIFDEAGFYDVTLVITRGPDNDQRQVTHTVIIRQSLEAEFSWDPQNPELGDTVSFSDESNGNPDTWEWDFGDGSYSSLQNPEHSYSMGGNYGVTLKIFKGNEGPVFVTHNVVVTAETLYAEFSWDPEEPETGENVSFYNESTGGADGWYWDFGDGSDSTDENPTHVFDTAGAYDVTLEITRSIDDATIQVIHRVIVQDSLAADFVWAPETPGVGEMVQFSDQSTGNPDVWTWDFGDGSTSSETNPIHSFDEAGVYLVTMEVSRSSDGVIDEIEKNIVVGGGLQPEFSWDPERPTAGEVVTFWDESVGNPDSWEWDFGDGDEAEGAQVSHVYSQAGSYVVTMTASMQDIDTKFQRSVQHTVIVGEPGSADFFWDPENPEAGEEVYFYLEADGDILSASWDFGDGGSSSETEPMHVFDDEGDYSVVLTVIFQVGNDESLPYTVNHMITVGPPGSGEIWFDWDPQFPGVGTEVTFWDESDGDFTQWSWDFGDGSTGSGSTVTHTYTESGSYEVTMDVVNASGTSSSVSRTIEISDDQYTVDFDWDPENPLRGQAVDFYDLSEPEPVAWYWDFGDGRSSEEMNPTHRFAMEGSYYVTLTVVFDEDWTLVKTLTQEIQVGFADLEADFFWLPIRPESGEEVEFYDLSIGEASQWSWDFGDGESSNEQDPIHTYSTAGTYDVTMDIWGGPDGDVHDSVTRTVRVMDPIIIDFSWDPEEPIAREEVRFVEETGLDASYLFWSFGDGEVSEDSEPVHIYNRPGHFTVQLWVAGDEGDIFSSVEHDIEVGAPEIDLELVASDTNPEIGQTVEFTVTSTSKSEFPIEAVMWNFGGLSCDGSPRIQECVPTDQDDCLSRSYTYSKPRIKPVRVVLLIDGDLIGPLMTSIEVQREGACEGAPEADFDWWPTEPLVGQQVRFVDRSTSAPESWLWTFDDSETSTMRHPSTIFDSEGDHDVRLEVSNTHGSSTLVKTVHVNAVEVQCGNSLCEPGENSWNCWDDCGDGRKGATGRTGRKNTSFAVPAAAGGVEGANGTYWVTDGNIINPSSEEAGIIIQFTPDGHPEETMTAGPAILPGRTAVRFDNMVEELFGMHELGGMWIDSSIPIMVNTRTFNQSDEGTFGQAIGGVSRQDILGEGDGSLYLVGLTQNQNFRTNLLLQEVSGHQATAVISIHNRSGQGIGTDSEITVPAGSRWQKNLSALGITSLDGGYAEVSVRGSGKLVVLGSKVDQRSGDATTIDPVHRTQMDFGAKAGGEAEHFLIAVVARSPGANNSLWRSEVSILNSAEQPENIEIRYVPSAGKLYKIMVELNPGEVFATPDIIANYFADTGDGSGSLHIYSQGGMVVSSRTYNLLPTDATVGQSIPGLSSGDMARPGEVWLLDSLRDDPEYRCNLGFAEYEGNDAEVTVVLFDTSAMAERYLGYKVYSVPAFSKLQVNRVFENFGIEGDVPLAVAYVSVSSDKGAVYSYASIVDNQVGDGTTILAKRQ